MSAYRTIAGIIFLLMFLTGCNENKQAKAPEIPVFQESALQQGRNVWMQVCRNCHLMGVAGAPAIDNYTAWKPRLEKDKNVLYSSAIDGIPSESGWTMPPRGGNESLSEVEVRQAVDFMIASVEQLSTGE